MDIVVGGLLLGVILTAMFLGHWYLNTPTMDLLPLRRLMLLMFLAVALRGSEAAERPSRSSAGVRSTSSAPTPSCQARVVVAK